MTKYLNCGYVESDYMYSAMHTVIHPPFSMKKFKNSIHCGINVTRVYVWGGSKMWEVLIYTKVANRMVKVIGLTDESYIFVKMFFIDVLDSLI